MHEGVVPNTPASHGCIRLPGSFARQLWGTTKLGARVIVSGAPVSPEPIEHARLFKFTPKPEQPENPGPAEGVPVSSDEAKAAYAMQATDRPATDNPSGGPATPETPKPAVAVKPLRPGPISVFISRKEGKLFVRKGFEPVFDVPVTFERPDQPLGTHVFTALAFNNDNTTLRWNVMLMPGGGSAPVKKAEKGKKVEVAVPTMPTWLPKRLLRHGLVDLMPFTSPSGMIVPPVDWSLPGGPTTVTVRMQTSPSRGASVGQFGCVTQTLRLWS
jgi:hypothetical protein